MRFFGTLLSLAMIAGLISCGPKGNQPNVEIIQNMMEQSAVKAQRYDEFFPHGISELVPPEGTKPVGHERYRWGLDAIAAEKELKNPLAGQMNPEVLMTGQKFFDTNCAVCHGQTGMGDGPVAAKYPLKIPPLVSDKVKAFNDGRIYHIITMGQGLMGPYGSHVPQSSRWQLVNYVRFLGQNKK